jgi:hypothetical protein
MNFKVLIILSIVVLCCSAANQTKSTSAHKGTKKKTTKGHKGTTKPSKGSGGNTKGSVAGVCTGVAIPAYFDPSSKYWKTATGSSINTILIANPNSGPGSSKDSQYATAINAAKSSGIKVIGYVHTSNGGRAIRTVKKEIDNWQSWYNIDGIFFDETATSSSKVSYYQQATSYVKSKAGKYVMLNPGTYPNSEEYMKMADNVCTFEDTYSKYQNSWSAPTWINNYSATKYTHIVHTTGSSSNMAKALSLAASRKAGYVFVTNDGGGNPYDTMPSYWSAEVSAVKGGCK